MDDHEESEESAYNSLETPGAQQMAAWTLRLAESPGFGWLLAADPHLFAFFYASCAAAVPAPEPLAGESGEAGAVDEKLLPTLKDLQRQFGERTSGRFVRLYLRGSSVFGLIDQDRGAFAMRCGVAEPRRSRPHGSSPPTIRTSAGSQGCWI